MKRLILGDDVPLSSRTRIHFHVEQSQTLTDSARYWRPTSRPMLISGEVSSTRSIF